MITQLSCFYVPWHRINWLKVSIYFRLLIGETWTEIRLRTGCIRAPKRETRNRPIWPKREHRNCPSSLMILGVVNYGALISAPGPRPDFEYSGVLITRFTWSKTIWSFNVKYWTDWSILETYSQFSRRNTARGSCGTH